MGIFNIGTKEIVFSSPSKIRAIETVGQPLEGVAFNVGEVLSQLPKAIEESIKERKIVPEPIKKVADFLSPKSPDEAIKMGYLPIKTKDGSYSYIDPFPIMGGIRKAEQPIAKILQSPVQKVISALKEARPIRRTQETLYAVERGARMARAKTIGEKITGEVGFYAEKAQLKGELPKVEFESIRGKLGQADINNLFITIKNTPILNDFEKITAREGISKLFGQYGGKVPTEGEIELLNKVFPKEFTDVLLSKRPFLDKFKEAIGQTANIFRSYMSSLDLSFGGRQGIFAAPKYRKEFFKSWKAQFKEFGSEKAYQEAMDTVTKNTLFELARDSGVSFTNVGRIMSQREERFMSQWAERIPILGKIPRASGRAYTGFANKFRMDIFSSLVKNAERLGLEPQKNLDLTKEIAEFVNQATGRGKLPGGLERAAPILNAFFFSPRLMSSRLRLLVPIDYVKAEPFIRKEYMKNLLTFAGTAMTVLGLSKIAGAEVEADPRSADFGKIKINDTRFDILGGFQQYIRLTAQLISGEIVSTTTGKTLTLGEGYKSLTRKDILERFIEYKEAPVFSFITALLQGRDFEGKPINVPKEIGIRFVPMILGDLVDIAKEDPGLLPLGSLGVFGIGLQSYESRKTKSIFK